jgi:hypothetical protein
MFVYMSFLPVYIYFMVISFFASLSVYFTLKNDYFYLKLFPPFLLATVLVESVGNYLGSTGKSNTSIYNFFTVFEFCFYLWVISLIVNSKQVLKIARVTAILYLLVAVINIIFIQKMKFFHSVTYAFGCLLIVAFCIYYFFELFKLPKSVKLKNNPAFWICSGLLFFYCCGFPLFGLTNFLSGISKLIINNFHSIIIILNIFLYSLFTIAFLCRIKIRKYILSR